MFTEKRLEECDMVLSEVILHYNTRLHSTTGFTPSFHMFGVQARIPSEILVFLHEMDSTPTAYAYQR